MVYKVGCLISSELKKKNIRNKLERLKNIEYKEIENKVGFNIRVIGVLIRRELWK